MGIKKHSYFKANLSSIYYIFLIWKKLSKKRKIQLILVLIFTLFGTFLETIAITTSIPFIGYLTNPNNITNTKFLTFIYSNFKIYNPQDQFIFISIIFGLSIISASISRLFILYFNINLSELIGLDLGTIIYKKSLYEPYIIHIKRSSSDLIDGISVKVQEFVAAINSFLQLISWTFIFLGILTSLIMINYKIAFASSFIFLFIYLFIYLFTSKKLLQNGKIVAKKSADLIEIIQDSFGGIRDIIIGKYQENYIKRYINIEGLRRKKSAEINFLTLSPKFILEAIGFTCLILIVIYLYFKSESSQILATLGGFAIGAQRLLPALQQIYSNIGKLKSYEAALEKIIILSSKTAKSKCNTLVKNFEFENSIELKNVSFQYSKDDKYILKSINMSIKKGESIGLKGRTGEGKSTLLDILMGLLEPSKGKFLLDGKNIYEKDSQIISKWTNEISHVPQTIFLSNNTIAKNIAFGIDKDSIDYKKLMKIISICQLSNFINKLTYGVDTFVGERGILLSGGQRQRIGIARALYKGSNVIFLDEATSALDYDTEKKIMNEIYKLRKRITFIIVAHRLSTLNCCDKIYELKDQKLLIT